MNRAVPILLSAAALLCPATAPARPSAPYISEIVARNTNGITDEDGDRTDWIELFNPNGQPFDLTGCSLSDNPADPAKWAFPAQISIPAGGYLVVFASSKNRAAPGLPLHTSFSIASAGEYLGFTDASGNVISSFSPSYPPQSANVSWGVISTVPSLRYAAFNSPTPGTANNTASAPAPPVSFSPPSRTFPLTSSISVAITTPWPGPVIRYTTDGSVPNATSPIVSGPLTISATRRIRARAFEQGRPDGPLRSESYLALDPTAADFSSNLPIVLTHLWNSGPLPTSEAPREGTWMIFEPSSPSSLSRLSNPPSLSGYGRFERRGSSTLSAAKYSFSLEAWDESNADLPISPFGMPAESDWILHAPFQFDRSLIRNNLLYQLSRNAGRYAPRTRFVEHFHSTADAIVNGAISGPDYFGVYSFMEKIDRDGDRVDVEKLSLLNNSEPEISGGYILKIDRLDTGDSGLAAANQLLGLVYPKERSPNPATMASTPQKIWLQNYLNSMWAALNAPDFWKPDSGYARFIDPAAAIDHHLLNTTAKNVDALRLSAYFHKPRSARLSPGPVWDFDRSMGSADGRDLNPRSWRGEGGDLGTDFFHYPWYAEMFRDSNFWQAWIDRLDALRNGPLHTDRVHALIDQLAAELNPSPLPPGLAASPAARNQLRWASSTFTPRPPNPSTPGTDGSFSGEIAWLRNWWAARLAFIDGQFTRPPSASPPPGTATPDTSVSLSSPSLSAPGAKIYFTTDGSDPRRFDTTHDTQEPSVTFIPAIHTIRGIVPNLPFHSTWGSAWRGSDLNNNGDHTDDFDDSSWHANPSGSIAGVGYDDSTGPSSISYLPFIGLRWLSAPSGDNSSVMKSVNQSCYLRIPFQTDAASLKDLVFLTLRARFDDGFVAFLNGSEIARANPPPSYPTTPLAWNAGARATNADSSAIQEAVFNVSAAIPLLHPGNNLLAIHGLNYGLSSSDFLFQATLAGGPAFSDAPEPSPSAIEYSSPIPISSPTIITARTYNPATPSDPPTQNGGGSGNVPNGSRWSAPVKLQYFPGTIPASPQNLTLSEILYHPASPSASETAAGFLSENDFEFIRLTNSSTSPIDLTGILFTAGISFSAAPNLQNLLPPNASTVIVRNARAWSARFGSLWPILGEFSGQLDNGGESISLLSASGEPIASLTYDDRSPWPNDSPRGFSIVLSPNLPPDHPASWSPSLDPGGSGVHSFALWRQRHFPDAPDPSESLALADPDTDGLPNLIEYALATDPARPGPIPSPALSLSPSPSLSIARRITSDLSWAPEDISFPSSPSPIHSLPSTSTLSTSTESASWPLPPPSCPHRRSLRLRVRLP